MIDDMALYELQYKIDRLITAMKLDIADAKVVCGGDGKGCAAFRSYYSNLERRFRKCGQCPMEVTYNIREILKEE